MKLSVLGSTGSIGVQALEVAEKLGMSVTALAAGKNTALAEKQARRFLPRIIALADEKSASDLKVRLADTCVKVLGGQKGVLEAARQQTDTVLNAIVGFAGLEPTLAAAECCRRVALANKESLVAGGELVSAAMEKSGAELIPVDSEHSAIFQCLVGRKQPIKKIILTASGGAFFGKNRSELSNVKVNDALTNPNWSMGAKITVDSATLMNKGLELIEAVRLFDVTADMIDITVHRQSILHSAVMFADNAVIAQLGTPDMRLPIQYALTYPERVEGLGGELDLKRLGTLTFSSPDFDTFYAPLLCKAAIERGGTAPAIVNGANEAAVALFIGGNLPFLSITEAAKAAFDGIKPRPIHTLEDVAAADAEAREFVNRIYAGRSVE